VGSSLKEGSVNIILCVAVLLKISVLLFFTYEEIGSIIAMAHQVQVG
jgi:hypothetical protein